MYCPECGKQNREDANYCGYCGYRLQVLMDHDPAYAPEFPEGDLSPIDGEDQDPEESEAAVQRVVYPPEQTFDYMERQQWTGTVTGVDGAKQALTVPVMRDMRTGVWYLGDPERKIAVGDFASLAYGEEQLQLIHRDRNEGWNDEDLITYANVIRVWDFYAAMGWTGPDGHGTPLLLLRNMCECICINKHQGIYDGAYRAVEIAMGSNRKGE